MIEGNSTVGRPEGDTQNLHRLGTLDNPYEIAHLVGEPYFRETATGHTVAARRYSGPESASDYGTHLSLAAGEIAVLRWRQPNDDGTERVEVVGAKPQDLAESCFGAPQRQGGLRILDADRANVEAYTYPAIPPYYKQ